MANTQAIQEAILRAVDTVVTQRTNELELDKTITAIIKKNLGFKNEKPLYQIQYGGGLIEAICQNKDDVYLPNTAVYVLIPQGNFSKEKIIIGLADSSTVPEKKAITIEENLYTKFSGNLLSENDTIYGLHSWHEDNNEADPDITHRYLYIYKADNENNDFSFKQKNLDIYKKDAIALMIKADFQTNLDIEQRQQINAKYGLIFNFIVDNNKNEQIIFSSDQMSGNSFLFNQWNSQYIIVNLDQKTLVDLDSILFFQEGFLQNYANEQVLPTSNPNTPDIFTKNIQIYLLKESSQLDDFSLKVEPYNNSDFIFTENNKDSELWFKALFLRQSYEDLTLNSKTKIHWFKEALDVIDFNNEKYNPLVGAGWEEIVQISSESNLFSTILDNNKAFKNNYKCLIEYSDITLIYDFSVYNTVNAPKIKLESDCGTNFSFSENLSPTISIKIKDSDDETFKEKGYNKQFIPYPLYHYLWCIIDNNNNKIFLTNEVSDNIVTQLAKATILKDLKEQTLLMDETVIEQNDSRYTTRIVFPINNISTNFSVVCYVQKKANDDSYFNIGSAQLDFINSLTDSDINNYIIEIKNDDQIFKYDIYGKAPTDESNKDPLIIKPLQVTLKTLAGTIVDINNYNVEWVFPTENTLLIAGTSENNQCNFDIQKNYNPDCFTNQITCHIIYNELNLYKDTRFYFGKEGDNGTNGTDVVAKINYARNNDIKNILKEQPVTLYVYNQKSFVNTEPIYSMRNTQTLFGGDNPIFKISLYQRANIINYSTSPQYGLAGNRPSRYFKTGQNLVWIGTQNEDNLPLIQNLKAEVQLNNNETYYAFITLPIIEYYVNPAAQESLISIDKQYYLNEIVYNNDGRNPIYNHNKGLKLNLPNNISIVEYRAKGGFTKQLINEEENSYYYPEFSPCFSLLDTKDSQAKQLIITKSGLDKDIIYILPDDNYGGSITNNRVEARCYDNNNNLIAIVYVPIHMSLNTFGLASLNAWDGNSVTIDNEGGYVMAPQVGAGEKDNNNRFTGILMGKTETYTGKADKEKQVGLFGYAKGLQSIFLDAETGNAIFGLPDGYSIRSTPNGNIPVEDEDDYGEGRIELRPGGESKIGGWKIGRRSLYYTMKPLPILDAIDNHVLDYITDINGRYKYEYSGEVGVNYKNDEETPKNRDYAEHHKKDIKVHDSGILFSSDPPYMSIVGTMLTENDIIGDSSTYLSSGDSIEVQLDPQTPTVFTIFRHNSEFRKQEALKNNRVLGDRTFLAGINSRGQLQANIIGTSDDNYNQASMYFGLTTLFNPKVDDDSQYIGAIFEGGNNSYTAPYLKMLIDKTEFSSDEDRIIDNVYLSVPGKLNVDFAMTRYTSADVPDTGTTGSFLNIDNNGHYYMEVGTLEDAIEGCLKAAEAARTGNLYIYNGND